MKKYLKEHVIAELVNVDNRRLVILGVGFATFFFGFAAGAILNLYLLWIQSPLVLQLRSSLSYKSAIFGDGIILPFINMVATFFLLRHTQLIRKTIIRKALFFGAIVTLYFHITQAMGGIVNWAMPQPWHWNFLGLWHALYMFSVTSFLSFFYLVLGKVVKQKKYVPKEAVIVTIGLVIFLVLLRLDYIEIDFNSLVPHF